VLIDFHAHLYDEAGYGEALAETSKNLGLDCLCIGGGEPRYGLASNVEVRKQADAYPDLFVPFAHFALGDDGPSVVERLNRIGFRGLCVWAPPAPYDDESFYATYEVAEALQMPILFHTGFMMRTPLDRPMRVRSANMRPVYLDTVARCFPDLKVVGVGLGNPWCAEAAETLRHNPNVLFDLSGDVLRNRGHDFFSSVLRPTPGSLWEEDPGGDLLSRIVFGSAARHEDIASVERDYQRILRSMALGPEDLEAVMGHTAAGLLGMPIRP
jgi:predicted TIM-barrel fold metal-dependent hydrolase